jgi:hypothetical protein
MESKSPNIIELTQAIFKFGLEKDVRVIALLSAYTANPSQERLNQILRIIKPPIIEQTLNPDPFIPYPGQEQTFGPIPIGKINKISTIFGLYPDELMRGMLIVGGYGTGKTNLCYILAECSSRSGINFIALDVKGDYRHMIKKLKNVLVFRPSHQENNSTLLFNPLHTTTDLVSWMQIFADITTETHNVYDGTSNYLLSCLETLYQNYETSRTGKFPTISELHQAIVEDKHPLITRDARYRESALNRLNLIKLTLGKASEYRKGYDINNLLENHNIVIELDSLSHASRIYLATLILAQIFYYRIRTRNCKPVIVIIDEANDIFNRELERKRGYLTIAQLARQAREFKLGIITSCQVPIALCDTALNAYTTVLFNLPEGKNLQYISSSIQLTEEQKAKNLELQTGQAITRIARLPGPIPISIPCYPIEKNVSDYETEEHMAYFTEELKTQVEKQETHDNTTRQTEPETEKNESKNEQAEQITKEVEIKEKSGISDDEKSFLMEIYLKPYFSITQHYENLNLSAGKGHRIVKALARKQLCNIQEINLGGRGGLTKFLVLTEQGYETIGMKEKKHISRGAGFEHEFWQLKIAETLKNQGYKVEIEKNLNNKFIDIGVETEKGIIAIEIAISSEHEQENIHKDKEAGCCLVIVACRNEKVRQEVEKIAQNTLFENTGKAKVCLVQELLKNNEVFANYLEVENDGEKS